MNWLRQLKWWWLPSGLGLPLLLATGCAWSGIGSGEPRPGDGVREYHRLVSDLREVVAHCVRSAETLAGATGKRTASAASRFDESAHQLEVASLRARARVEAMEKRGAAYFEEWAEEISRDADAASRQAAGERFAELRRHFDDILRDTGQVRQEFRPFLDGVRVVRAQLGPSPSQAAIEQARPSLAGTAVKGRQVEAAADRLLTTLKVAEATVVAKPPRSPKPQDKP